MSMRKRNKRFALEGLEERWTPAITVAGGGTANIVVYGKPVGAVEITQTADGTFDVFDDGNLIATKTTSADLIVKLGSTNDNVTLDLGGFTAPDDIQILLGAGNDQLAVINGEVTDDLLISGSGGDDIVDIGDGVSPLVADDLSINLWTAGTDEATIHDQVTITDDFTSYYVNTLTLEEGSEIGDDLWILGGTAGNDVTLDGNVGHDVKFYGSNRASAVDTFTQGANSTVGHDMILYTDNSAHLSVGGSDTVVLNGTVDNYLFINAAGGSDNVELGSTFSITNPTGRMRIYLGNGNDSFTTDATLPAGLTGTVDGGSGTDTKNENVALPPGITDPNF